MQLSNYNNYNNNPLKIQLSNQPINQLITLAIFNSATSNQLITFLNPITFKQSITLLNSITFKSTVKNGVHNRTNDTHDYNALACLLLSVRLTSILTIK